jgi:GMP synthase (glutamine-hydrolysing)
MTHVDTLAVLPPGARVLGRTAKDPHAVVRFAPSAWGVQFHPEIDRDVMRIYLEERRELVRAEGGDPEGLLAAVGEGAFGKAVLGRFLERVR